MNIAAGNKIFKMVLSPRSGRVTASIDARGPSEPLKVAVGSGIDQALQLAPIIYPICPRAHQAAALNAAESLAGIDVSTNQALARELLVLAEAIVGCVMRHDVVWLHELDRAPITSDYRRARAASDRLAALLFKGDWARPGGSAISIDGEAAKTAIDTLLDVADRVSARAKATAADIPSFCVVVATDGDCHNDIVPIDQNGEETPRIIHAPGTADNVVPLADWFDAQIRHLKWLAERLSAQFSSVSDEPSVPVAPKQLDGTGIGVAMTARGRLRHSLTLDNGKVQHWRSVAPTDLNFAKRGPVSQIASNFRFDPDLSSRAGWLVQAFDPCAHCEVTVLEEAHHA